MNNKVKRFLSSVLCCFMCAVIIFASSPIVYANNDSESKAEKNASEQQFIRIIASFSRNY